MQTFHPEDVRAALKKKYRTIGAFEVAHGLPQRSVSDLLRGKSKTAMPAVAKVLGIESGEFAVAERLQPARLKMSAPIHTVGAKVCRDGRVLCGGKQFWSPETVALAGRWVTLLLPRRDDTSVFVQARGGEKIEAGLIDDRGFCDIEGARAIAQRWKDYQAHVRKGIEAEAILASAEVAGRVDHASIVRRQIVALVEVIDQRIERFHVSRAVVRQSLLTRAIQRLKDIIEGRRPTQPHGVEQGELKHVGDALIEQLLAAGVLDHALRVFHGRDSDFEIVKAALNLQETLAVGGHSNSPSADASETIQPADAAHRLSGAAK